MKDGGLMIIDAHAMAYRAYYAMQGQNLTHPVTGQPTTAIFGFFRMLFKLLLEYRPALTAITWDAPGGSFRNEQFTEYKATRKPMPDDLRYQIDEIKELARRCGFALIEEKGLEADDLMGALSVRYGKGRPVILLTGDKDCYQLLNKNVKMLRGTKGVSEFVVIDPEWVKKELGVAVDEIPDYMALVGDASDNIPGAKGIGPKSAQKLIEQYHSIDEIYKRIDSVTPAGTREKLIESKEAVYLSRELAVIRTTAESVDRVNDVELHTPDLLSEEILQLFRHEGYNGIYNELLKNKKNAPAAQPTDAKTAKKKGKSRKDDEEQGALFPGEVNLKEKIDAKYLLIDSIEALETELKKIAKAKRIAVDTETDSEQPTRARLVGISMSASPKTGIYIALPPKGTPFEKNGLPLAKALPLLRSVIENDSIEKIGQNIKYDLIVLRRHGIEIKNIVFDTMIASYLLNPNIRRHNLDDMALDILSYDTIKYDDIAGSGRNRTTLDNVAPEQIRDYACEDADITLRLHEKLLHEIGKNKLEPIINEIEIPLIPVLARMEEAGIAIDASYFKKLSKQFEKKIAGLEKAIHTEAGQEFNINSTKELQFILFEKLQLPKGKKTKTGYSTDQSVLEELRELHPMVQSLLDHRKYSKLKSTYVDALPELIHPETGRIHTSFNQTIAATGRLSSNEPNLQNIPIREEEGRAIRRGFVPAKGCELLSLDYSQIELRIMAHYSQDEALMEAFIKDDIDIHRRTAASLFGISEEAVNADQRAKAKVVNFSIIYGVTDFGLARSLGIGRNEAGLYIDRFFERYPGVRRYMDDTFEFAEKHGYVQTLNGRKRPIPDITSSNRFRKEGAKRTAINTPIQGTSADIIKLAMIKIDDDFGKKKIRSKMILQVHDELLFDVHPEEKQAVLEIAKERMEKIVSLRIPLRVDWKFGKNWDEAH